jgi:mevalonate kinase
MNRGESSSVGAGPWARGSSPGKLILFGEHAVVYGEPALAVAINLRTEVRVREAGDVTRVNGHPIQPHHHAYIRDAVELLWKGGPLDIRTDSRLPSASGLGSSAALSVATVAALLRLSGRLGEGTDVYARPAEAELVAREAYATEVSTQKGRGSPTDTSTCTHGGAVLVDRQAGPGLLWTIQRGERTWHLHHLDVPPLTIVVGNTGVRGRTADQVQKVARFVQRTGFAREVIRDLGRVARSAVPLLKAHDKRGLGERMDEAHNLLSILGVSTPRLDELCQAARKHAYGAKLTGSGGGGSMIALTDQPEACAKAIAKRGGTPTIVSLGGPGVTA